ncbi:MAG: aromatic amino acid lyase, partial [Pseudomonadota bacterium]
PVERLKQHLIAINAWSEDRHVQTEAEILADVTSVQKTVEAAGTMLDPGPMSSALIFDGVYKDMPEHLRRQRQMGAALIGEGALWFGTERVSAHEGLARLGLAPLTLEPKDALALANHSSVTIAVAGLAAARAMRLVRVGMAAAALACEGYATNLSIFDKRLNRLRPAGGQAEAAAWFRRAFVGSSLAEPGSARSIQDALSFRTLAPVFGVAVFALSQLTRESENELNGICDNPVVLIQALQNSIPDDEKLIQDPPEADLLSTPNFQSAALAHALDSAAIAIAQAANGTAQRIVKLMMPGLTGLPKYLSPVGGASAGFVPLQKTAAALLAEIKLGAQPASLEAMPVSDGVEDVAPQSMLSAIKLTRQLDAFAYLVAAEALVAAQAVDLRKPARLGQAAGVLFKAVRQHVPPLTDDRPIGPDLDRLKHALEDNALVGALATL